MNFDLDIQHYKKEELEEIFELPSTYDSKVVDVKEGILRQSIINNTSVDESIKIKTIFFLAQAKKRLLEQPQAKKRLLEQPEETQLSFEKKVFNVDTLSLTTSKVNTSGESFVIEKTTPSTPYLNANPSNFFPGTLNPLNKRITRQNLNIDTKFRDNYYNSTATNYQLDLPNSFKNVVSMQLTAFEFPTAFFNVSKSLGTNFFNITIGTVTKQVIVPDGNYIPSEMMSFLNNYMISNFPGTDFQYVTFGTDIYNQSGSGRLLVTLNDKAPAMFNFILNFQADINGNPDEGTPLPLKLGWLLGFRQGIYVNNSAYCSEGLVDLIGIKYMYLSIDEYSNNVNNSFYGAFNESLLNKNILARISIQGLSFQSLSQNNLMLITHPREYFGPIDIQSMRIQLLDEYGRIIQLNNMDYSFCLTFESVYNL